MNDDRMDEIIREAAREYNRPLAEVPREEIWARVQQARQTRQAPRANDRVPNTAPRREWIWRGIGIAAVLAIGIGIGGYVERRQSGSSARVSPAARTATTATSRGADSTRGSSPSAESAVAPEAREIDGASTNPQVIAATPNVAPNRSTPGFGAPNSTVDGDMPSTPSGNGNGLALRLALVKHLAGTEAMLTSFRTSAKSGDVDAQLMVWAKDLLRTTRLLQISAASERDPTLRRLLDDLELVLLQISQYTSKSSDHAQELELIERSIEKRGVIAKLRTTSPATYPAGT